MAYDQNNLKWVNMLAGIKAQVPYLRSAPKEIYNQIRENFQPEQIPERVYLTGNGDSWYCGMATRQAFTEWAGISAEVPQALEFSRYLVKNAPQNGMLIAISNSGKVSRTIEAVIQANIRGLFTVGCTSNFSEGISQYANAVIDLGYAEKRFAPGTSSYMASLVVQYCLALRLAELNSRMSADYIGNKLGAISMFGDAMEHSIQENWGTLEKLSEDASLDNQFTFLGAGPNLGTAYFCMAKMIEAAQVNAVGQELEEWAHEQYFVTNKNTITFLIAPPGASIDRAREILYTINQTGATSVVICAEDDKETQSSADVAILIPECGSELLTPLLYCVPAELFAYFFASSKNLNMFGFEDQNIKDVNFKTIYHSRILKN